MIAGTKKEINSSAAGGDARRNLSQYATQEWKERITELAMEAYRGPRPKDEKTRSQYLLFWPRLRCRNSQKDTLAPNITRFLGKFEGLLAKVGHSLRNKICDLLEILPGDTEPPFPQMRERF